MSRGRGRAALDGESLERLVVKEGVERVVERMDRRAIYLGKEQSAVLVEEKQGKLLRGHIYIYIYTYIYIYIYICIYIYIHMYI